MGYAGSRRSHDPTLHSAVELDRHAGPTHRRTLQPPDPLLEVRHTTHQTLRLRRLTLRPQRPQTVVRPIPAPIRAPPRRTPHTRRDDRPLTHRTAHDRGLQSCGGRTLGSVHTPSHRLWRAGVPPPGGEVGCPPYHGVGAGVYVLRPGCFGGVGRRRCDRARPPWAAVRRRWWWPHRARRLAGRWSSGASMWSTSVAGASQRTPVSPRMAVQRWPSRSRMARRMAGQLRGSGVVRPLVGPHGMALPARDGVAVFGRE